MTLTIDESGFNDLNEEEAYSFALYTQNQLGITNTPSFIIKGYFGINT